MKIQKDKTNFDYNAKRRLRGGFAVAGEQGLFALERML